MFELVECLRKLKIGDAMHRKDYPEKWMWLESIAENGHLNLRAAFWAITPDDLEKKDWVIKVKS